ncbi:Fe-only/vanadium nitrogenase subunit delta [Ethanoligenens harbinense]|uniref:nitrogenase n=1 Tax=Ethanoligenens harbinense (strain DSM 18485 / JCM 12961 / CGMCC 1.5033 / YUAN-3) TaxID=663278 RepID=E6U4U0_ETHHY|nr:Fe-only/vanadium nitrogenase subunit delta [Ethanoligenens harbinense]ADU27825.1 Vanadium/alternative nitrogenase delta subunit [Ethanoligenens harbinense YUAN-3]AVQ96849.1 hypothetical protein CXQ68_11900 [Ethanoligenens harbinense YUAN-3]AYF39511.1 hypothetical protein CXP51_11795 [Ethanoligenens harbinense]AYF42336.1 hypothetical protein CN246_12345 [Ethanoligenens harbinense]QCN93090.1 hypothetical protein DRA42_11935 [Ethanoligenens harbinense]
MSEKTEQLFLYLQERCLFQFHSRSWDREENIHVTCEDLVKLLTGEKVLRETPEDRCHYADAVLLAEQVKEKFPWMLKLSDDERRDVIQGAFEKLMDVTVTNSRNAELNNENY